MRWCLGANVQSVGQIAEEFRYRSRNQFKGCGRCGCSVGVPYYLENGQPGCEFLLDYVVGLRGNYREVGEGIRRMEQALISLLKAALVFYYEYCGVVYFMLMVRGGL